ncbi:hypothetical protein DFH06DRAFT_702627 [Mycena polygramma]|nr:hypothetical protein DFH06DRAFT_702627 [Mycena polygramma]
MTPNECSTDSSDLESPGKPVDLSTISRETLDTNDPPAEFHLAPIREFVSRGSARRALLDTRIAPLKAELEKLQQERDALDVEIRKHEGALSPLRRLPTEIICLIFMFATAPYIDLLSVKDGPWVLSAVCSRWRTILLSQPHFWSSLALDFTDHPPESPSLKGLVPMLAAQLERSQSLPLNITFCTFYDHDCSEREQRVLELIRMHCDRWEDIVFSGPETLYARLDAIRDEVLTILRKVDITVRDHFSDDPEEVFDLFQPESCPRLEDVLFNAGSYGGDRPKPMEFPFSQLRRYSASNSWTNHVHVLHSASSLVDCVLRLNGAFPDPADTLVLPHLLRLSVSTNALLRGLDTPALQELYGCDSSGQHSSDLYSFLKRLPKLRKLFVAGVPSIPDISQLLQGAPLITELCLYLPMPFASDLFSILEDISQDDRATTAPALRALSLSLGPLGDTLGEPLDEDLLMRAVESQWRDGTLRSFRLYAMKFRPSADTLKRMEVLRNMGMEIVYFEKSRSLYAEMVPEYFSLYRDSYDFFRLFLDS